MEPMQDFSYLQYYCTIPTFDFGFPSWPSHWPEERASACSLSITHSAARHNHNYREKIHFNTDSFTTSDSASERNKKTYSL